MKGYYEHLARRSVLAPVDPDRAVHLRATLGALVPLILFSSTVLALRFYTRLHIVRKVGIDDYLLGIAWILCMFVGISYYLQLQNGIFSGVPMDTLSGFWMRIPWIAGGVHWLFKLPVKLSVTIFYLSTFKGIKFKTLTYATLLVGGSASVIGMAASFIAASISLSDSSGRMSESQLPAISRDLPYIVLGALDIVTTFLVVFIPLPWLYQLSLNVREKSLVLVMFVGGLFCSIACVFTLTKAHDSYRNPESTFHASELVIWGAIKGHFAIALAAALGLRPLIDLHFPTLMYGDQPKTTSNENTPNSQSSKSSIIPGSKASEVLGLDFELPTRRNTNGSEISETSSSSSRRGRGTPAPPSYQIPYQNQDKVESLENILRYTRGREAMEAPEYGVPYQRPVTPQETVFHVPQWGHR